MLGSPGDGVVDFYFAIAWRMAPFNQHGHREPLRAAGRFDAVTIAPAVFVVLNIVIYHKCVAFGHLVEVTQPRKVARL